MEGEKQKQGMQCHTYVKRFRCAFCPPCDIHIHTTSECTLSFSCSQLPSFCSCLTDNVFLTHCFFLFYLFICCDCLCNCFLLSLFFLRHVAVSQLFLLISFMSHHERTIKAQVPNARACLHPHLKSLMTLCGCPNKAWMGTCASFPQLPLSPALDRTDCILASQETRWMSPAHEGHLHGTDER